MLTIWPIKRHSETEAIIMKVGGLGYQPENKYGVSQQKPNEIAQNASSKDVFKMSQRLTIASQVSYQKMMGAMPFEQPAEKVKPESLFDFEEVAKNVLQFVKGAIKTAQAEGADNDKLSTMFEQARKGVEQGIGEAVDELKESDLFNDEIEQGINQSRELIFDGIDEFEQSIFNPEAKQSNFNAGDFYQLENGASFEIKTAEGDVIKLTYNSEYSASQSLSYSQSQDGESFSYSSSSSSQQSFAFSVEGDLSKDEVKAINSLMKELQKVSDEFFNGSLDEAFEKAQELSLGSPQLVAMSMNLQQSETRASVREYQTSQPGAEIAKQFEPLNEGLAESVEQAKPLKVENQLLQLLTWLNQKRANSEGLLDYSKAFFDRVNEQPELKTSSEAQ